MNHKPAYPVREGLGPTDHTSKMHFGLTKLEWFAGIALQGFLASQNPGPTDHKQMIANAEQAFTQAEYMIKESLKSDK